MALTAEQQEWLDKWVASSHELRQLKFGGVDAAEIIASVATSTEGVPNPLAPTGGLQTITGSLTTSANLTAKSGFIGNSLKPRILVSVTDAVATNVNGATGHLTSATAAWIASGVQAGDFVYANVTGGSDDLIKVLSVDSATQITVDTSSISAYAGQTGIAVKIASSFKISDLTYGENIDYFTFVPTLDGQNYQPSVLIGATIKSNGLIDLTFGFGASAQYYLSMPDTGDAVLIAKSFSTATIAHPPVTNSASSGGAKTIDWSASLVQTFTLSENVTFSFSNSVSGETLLLKVTNTAGNFTVTWPTIKWVNNTAPVQTTGAKTDIYSIVNIDGTFYGSYTQNYS